MRLVRGSVGAVGWIAVTLAAVGLSACLPAQPAPSYPNPTPTMTVQVTPTEPVAGQPLHIEVHAQHPVAVTSVTTQLARDIFPNELVQLPASYGCGDDAQHWSGPPTDVVVTIDCVLPAEAPRGHWKLNVAASALDSGTARQDLDLNVIGTSNDTTAPVEVDSSFSPATLVPGEQVVFTTHVSDQHGPISAGTDIYSYEPPVHDCTSASSSTTDPTIFEVRITCTVSELPWGSNGVTGVLADAFGFSSRVNWVFPIPPG